MFIVYTTLLRSIYNKHSQHSFKEIHDFVLFHYLNSKRDDSEYWRHIKNNVEIPESVLEYVTSGTPLNPMGRSSGVWFGDRQLECILVGMGTPSMFSVSTLGDGDNRLVYKYTGELKQQALAVLAFLDNEIQVNEHAVSVMLNHEDYLLREVYTN